jgi:dephospho-CoA kinase
VPQSCRRYLIGLTGNIATGKTAVLHMLEQLGAYVIDADALVHRLMVPGTEVYQAVVERFGRDILRPDGAINRAKLGEVVFADPAALKDLERIVHPAVRIEVDRLIEQAPKPIVVVEAIKLIEAGMHRGVDALWVVTCSREQQLARLMRKRGLSLGAALTRVEAQPPQEEKNALADVLIDNSGTLEETRAQVERHWQAIGDLTEMKVQRGARGNCAES